MVVGMGQGWRAPSLSHFGDAGTVTRKVATHHGSMVRSIGRDQDSAARMSLARVTSLCLSRAPSRGLGNPLQDTHLEPSSLLALFQVKGRELLGPMHLKIRPLRVSVQPCE